MGSILYPLPKKTCLAARANLIHVKAVRIWLLLVLVVLLPVRGAVAAAMLCSAGSPGMGSELRIDAGGHGAMDHTMAHEHAGQHPGHDDADGGGHDHAGAGGHDHAQGHTGSDQCSLCSACCSITPLPSTVPKLVAPVDARAVKFPDVSSPAPTFLSDGQERPPRSI